MKLIPKHQTGNIIKREGDPYQYKKSGNQYLYRKTGETNWTTATGTRGNAIQGLFNSPTSSAPTSKTKPTNFSKTAVGQYIDATIKPTVNPASTMTWDFNNPTNPTNQKLMQANRAYHQENNAATKKSEQDIQIQAKQDMLRKAGYKIKSDGV